MRILMAMLLVMALATLAQADGAGTSAAAYLRTGQGARPMGLGGAYCALAEGSHGMYWNPGGLGVARQADALFMYHSSFADINNQFLAFAYPLGNDHGTIGAAATYVDYGDMDRYMLTGGTTYSAAGTFEANDLAVALGYGGELAENVGAGVSLKYLRGKLESENANAFAADFGVMYASPASPWRFGLALTNLGTRMKYISKKDKLPLDIRGGGAYTLGSMGFVPGTLMLACDVHKPVDNDCGVNVGLEYQPIEQLAFRVGYDSLQEAGNGLTLGAGFGIEQFAVDYAWVDGGALDDAHRVSLQLKFGGEKLLNTQLNPMANGYVALAAQNLVHSLTNDGGGGTR